MLTALPCPQDGAPLILETPTCGLCPTCHTEYVVSVCEAHPTFVGMDRTAPFASLVLEVDNIVKAKIARKRTESVA
jgi:hypothetical protein